VQYNTSDFRKGLKVQINGEPYLMTECNFVKPGKGNALYKCRLKNLVRGSSLDKTYRGGETLESADVEETDVQFLYKQGETWVFMDNATFDQYELDTDQVGDAWKFLQEGMKCMMTLFNGNPLDMNPPIQVEMKVDYCEPGVRGDTATNVTKPATIETGAEIQVPAFVEMGDVIKVDTRTGDYVERVKK